MNDWIKSLPEIVAADATVIGLPNVSEATREEFWARMSALPPDPYFEVTSNGGGVSIFRRKEGYAPR
jgi:hypothetical protein